MNPLSYVSPYMTLIKWGAAILLPILIFGAGYKKGHAPVKGLKEDVTALTVERDEYKGKFEATEKGLKIAQDGLDAAARGFRQINAENLAEAAALDRMQAKGQLAASIAVKENIKLHGDIAALNKAIEQERDMGDCPISGEPLR